METSLWRNRMTDGRSELMEIVVIVGGASPEAEVSRDSGAMVRAALQSRGHAVQMLEATPDLLCGLTSLDCDCAWLATHGPWGEDGTLQGLLEMLRIPYTGSGVLASAVAMDKVASRHLIADLGVAINPWLVVDLGGVERIAVPEAWAWPLIVKPAAGGSSVATRRVQNPAELRDAVLAALAVGDKVMLEPFLTGRELSVALFDDEVLGDVEIRPPNGIFDFDAKYRDENTEYVVFPDLPAEVRSRMHRESVAIARRIGCEGISRVDWFWVPGGDNCFLEVNTIPGMTDHSLVPMIAAAAGVSLGELCERAALEARTRCG